MDYNTTITGVQIKCARCALGWSAAKLAETSKISISTIKRIELETGVPNSTNANVTAICNALETAGIEFVGTPDDGPGIRIHLVKNL